MAHRFWRGLWAPVDGASLAFARVAFGLLMVWHVASHFAYGWIERDYTDPTYHFAFFGLEWLAPWPSPFTHLHFAVLGLLGVGIALGYRYRICTALFAVGYTTVFLWEQAAYQNHLYLICLLALLLCLVPAHRVASLDARRSGRTDGCVPRWSLLLLRFQVAVPYFFGGLSKLSGDWLDGQPMGMWLAERADFPLIGRWFGEPWMVAAFVWGGLLFDLAIVPLLLFGRTRAWAFAGAVVFHLINARLFSIGVFPWLMIAMTSLFLAPDWPRKAWSRVARAPLPVRASDPDLSLRPRPLLAVTIVAWVVVQVALPVRPLLHPGRADWTEEGQRFSWRMKLRDKRSLLDHVTLHDRSSGRIERVDLREHLTGRQLAEMCKNPHMIRQFARHLSAVVGGSDAGCEMRAHLRVSLNGRPFQLLIRPDVDLASEGADPGPSDWVVPLLTDLPSDPISMRVAPRHTLSPARR